MIDFKPITLENKALYESYLSDGTERGCDYSFVNLYLWGRQKAAVLLDHLVLFSQYNRCSVYPYPAGRGEKKPVLDALIADAGERGIPCRITGMTEEQKNTLESLYPGRFRFQCDRDSFDYVYDIDDLADLKGGKYHRKRNHYRHFQEMFPNYTAEALDKDNLPAVRQMTEKWYEVKQQQDPGEDCHLEKAALAKALRHYRELGMEGLVLCSEGEVLAVTLGSRLSEDTFDVHFEKARSDMDGAYAAVNYEFARKIRSLYPRIRYLNREDDMGIEGLRRAKQSYFPHHMVEKYWACLLEDGYDY